MSEKDLPRYRVRGLTKYSDVSELGPWFGSKNEALMYGEKLLDAGNWYGYTVEMWHFKEGYEPPVRAMLADHSHLAGGVYK